MRRGVVAGVVALGLALVVVPALAADDETLQARDFEFEPADVTIRVGDTVTFTIDPNSGNFHNFDFDGGSEYPEFPSGPGAAWNDQKRTFSAPGTYTYVCGAHGFMTGVINVLPATSTPTPTGTPTPTPTATSDPTTSESDGTPLEVRRLRLAAASFCTKRGKRCAKPGVKLQIDLSQPATVTGTLTRRPPRGKRRARSFGRVDFGTVSSGPRTLTFTRNAAGKRLTGGRYKLKLVIAGRPPETLSFRVR